MLLDHITITFVYTNNSLSTNMKTIFLVPSYHKFSCQACSWLHVTKATLTWPSEHGQDAWNVLHLKHFFLRPVEVNDVSEVSGEYCSQPSRFLWTHGLDTTERQDIQESIMPSSHTFEIAHRWCLPLKYIWTVRWWRLEFVRAKALWRICYQPCS